MDREKKFRLILIFLVFVFLFFVTRDYEGMATGALSKQAISLNEDFYNKMVFVFDDERYSLQLDPNYMRIEDSTRYNKLEDADIKEGHVDFDIYKEGQDEAIGEVTVLTQIIKEDGDYYLYNDDNDLIRWLLYDVIYEFMKYKNLPHPIVSHEETIIETKFDYYNQQLSTGQYQLYSNGKFFRVYIDCDDLDFSKDEVVFIITYEQKLKDKPVPTDWYD